MAIASTLPGYDQLPARLQDYVDSIEAKGGTFAGSTHLSAVIADNVNLPGTIPQDEMEADTAKRVDRLTDEREQALAEARAAQETGAPTARAAHNADEITSRIIQTQGGTKAPTGEVIPDAPSFRERALAKVDAAPGVKKKEGYDLQQALLTKGITADLLATAGFKATDITAAQKKIADQKSKISLAPPSTEALRTAKEAPDQRKVMSPEARSKAATLKKMDPFAIGDGYDLATALRQDSTITAAKLKQADFSASAVNRAQKYNEAHARVATVLEAVSSTTADTFRKDGVIDPRIALEGGAAIKDLRALTGMTYKQLTAINQDIGLMTRSRAAQREEEKSLNRLITVASNPDVALSLQRGNPTDIVHLLANGADPEDLKQHFDKKTVDALIALRSYFQKDGTIDLLRAVKDKVPGKTLRAAGFSPATIAEARVVARSKSRPILGPEPPPLTTTDKAPPSRPISAPTPTPRKVPPPGEKFPVPQWLKDDLKEVKVSPVPAGPVFMQPGASGLPQEAFRNVQSRAIKEATKRYQAGDLTEAETRLFVNEIKKQPPRSQNLHDVGYIVPGLGTYMSYRDMQRSGGAPLETGFFVVSATLDTVLFAIPMARGFRITAIPKTALKLLSPTRVRAALTSEQGGGRIRVSPNKRLSGSMTASEINRELDRLQALPKVAEKPRDRGLQRLVEITKEQDHQKKLEELRTAYTRQRPAPAQLPPPSKPTPGKPTPRSPGRGRQLDSPFSRWEIERQRQRVRQGLTAEELARISRRRPRITPAQTEQLAERMLRNMGLTSKLIGGKGVAAPLTQAEYRILTGLLSKKKALSKTQAEQLKQLLTHTQPSPTVNIKPGVITQPRTKLVEQTSPASSAPPSTATVTKTRPLSQTETASLTELLTKTRLRTDTQTETATESTTKTRPLSQTETATLTELLTKTRLLNQTDTASLADLASKTRPLTSTETTLLNKLLSKTRPATESTTKTKTNTQLKPARLPTAGSPTTGRPSQPRKPPRVAQTPTLKKRLPRFTLPDGKELPAGVFPGIVEWKQGMVGVRFDMRTAQAKYRRLRTPGLPRQTFRVVTTTPDSPDPRLLELGVVDVVIRSRGLDFVRSGRRKTLQDVAFPQGRRGKRGRGVRRRRFG